MIFLLARAHKCEENFSLSLGSSRVTIITRPPADSNIIVLYGGGDAAE